MKGRFILLILVIITGILCQEQCRKYNNDAVSCQNDYECCYVENGSTGLCLPWTSQECIRVLDAHTEEEEEGTEEEEEEDQEEEEIITPTSSTYASFKIFALIIAFLMF